MTESKVEGSSVEGVEKAKSCKRKRLNQFRKEIPSRKSRCRGMRAGKKLKAEKRKRGFGGSKRYEVGNQEEERASIYS